MSSDTWEEIVSLTVLVSLIALITTLLCKNKIKATAYTILLPMVCVVALLHRGFDRLKEFDGKNLRMVLNEVNQAKKDVYAKAESVRSMGEQIADLAVVSVQMSPQLLT